MLFERNFSACILLLNGEIFLCKLGDIIVVNKYIGDDGNVINRHSFVVVDDEKGVISGLDYDMVASAISSFKGEEHRKKKLKYKENMELPINSMCKGHLKNDSYIKVDQAYYFKKDKIDYYVLGRLKQKYVNKLLRSIIHLDSEDRVKIIINNL